MDQPQRQDDSALSLFACLNCRNGHRRCGKQLPACSLCVRKKRECKYEKPKAPVVYKPKRIVFTDVTKRFIQSANEPPTNAREEDLLRLFIVSNEMDLTFDKTTYLVPLIDKEIVALTLSFIKCGVHKERAIVESQPSDTTLALIYAIQSVSVLRMGNKYFAQKLYQKARELVFPYCDLVEQDYTVAACFAYLAIYMIFNGDITHGMFFLSNCRTHCDAMNKNDKYFGFLNFMLSTCEICADTNTTCLQAFNTLSALRGLYHHYREDTTVSPKQSASVLYTVDETISALEQEQEKLRNTLPPNDIQVKRVLFGILGLGAKIEYMNSLGLTKTQETLKMANEITAMVMWDSFSSGADLLAKGIVEAARVQIEFLPWESGLIDAIKTDLYGLKILAEKYPLVAMRNSSFIEQLELIIKERQT